MADPLKGVVASLRQTEQQVQKGPPLFKGLPYWEQVWSFRLDRKDPSGSANLPGFGVEIRGKTISGVLDEGDEVGVFGKWKPGQTLRSKRVRNLTTRS